MNTGDPAPRFGFRRVILLSCAIALGVYHIFASAVMYPVPGGDAHVFMPAAINLKAGRGLTNPLWEVAPDPTGQHRYVAHPPLFQMIVSACMGQAETRSAFIVLGVFNALTLALYAAFLCSAKCARKMVAATAGFVVLLSSIFALAFLIFNDAGGRPEVLSTLILTLAIGVVTWLPRQWWPVCLGIAIGVTAAVHPVHGIFIGCLTTIAFLLTTPVPQVVTKLILAAVVALALFWSLLSLSPYPVGETLHAVSDHAALANGDYPLSALIDFYVKLAPWSGLYLLGLCLLLVWCGVQTCRSAESRVTRAVRLVALLLTAFAFWFFSIRRPTSSYYLMMLTPALIAGAIYLFDVRGESDGRRSAARPLWIMAALFGVFSLFLARDLALFVNYRTDGVSYSDAQKDFGDLMRSSGQVVGVSESLWVLADEFDRITVVERGSASGDLMVLQQTQRRSLSPPVIPGYRLISDHFVPHPPRCFGWPIGRTMPGYSFAVFAREGSVEENRPPTNVPHGS